MSTHETLDTSTWACPSHTFYYDGRPVAWDVLGDGTPVVLVHGTPWSSYNLRHLAHGLARHHTVFYYDMLGYGCSAKEPGDVSLGIQNKVLHALLDHWGLVEPAIIGHDFGGATVLRARLLDHRRFSHIVLIDPVAISPWGSSFFRHVSLHEEAFVEVPSYMHEAMVRSYIQTATHRPMDGEIMARTVQPWLGDKEQAAFYRQIAQSGQRHTDEVEGRYGEIDEPVLILWGEEDSWIPVERGVALRAMIPHAKLETIPNTGHLVIEEAPEGLLTHLRPFIG